MTLTTPVPQGWYGFPSLLVNVTRRPSFKSDKLPSADFSPILAVVTPGRGLVVGGGLGTGGLAIFSLWLCIRGGRCNKILKTTGVSSKSSEDFLEETPVSCLRGRAESIQNVIYHRTTWWRLRRRRRRIYSFSAPHANSFVIGSNKHTHTTAPSPRANSSTVRGTEQR
jgi:hypothetical protein